ncbi:MAG: 2-amino-4-hydroxy-6-hydroxymethyldihydropteridine diphosphokinase [Caldilineaceae bacterium]|nr:2-amino-4-hydroxy-6-hydroxymethyldihydropteridine diphosphokinase [Caldilineaceae bacterium]
MVETNLTAGELRQVLRSVEAGLGRVRSADKFAPRTIDLDITLFGQEILNLDGSQIPDVDIVRYAHVATPIAELCPLWRHPQTGQTLSQIAENLGKREMEIV